MSHNGPSTAKKSIVDVQCVSSVQQSDSVILMCVCIYIYILFFRLFSLRLLLNIEYSSLCYTVGPSMVVILHIVVCMY